jgi:rfaE bifunctional protein nucleotidyltransferase chain/domain
MPKVSSFEEVLAATNAARKKGKKIVATNGCFDILHVGHIRNLEAAKKHGDILVVGVNSDASVRSLKGNLRPIVPGRERAELLASLGCVDHVFIFSGRTPFSWIRKLRPHIHVKGADVAHVPEYDDMRRSIEESGGTCVLIPLQKGKSTTNIIEKIRTAYGKAPKR